MSLQVYARTHPRLRRQRIIITIIIASMAAAIEFCVMLLYNVTLILELFRGFNAGFNISCQTPASSAAKLVLLIQTAKSVEMFFFGCGMGPGSEASGDAQVVNAVDAELGGGFD